MQYLLLIYENEQAAEDRKRTDPSFMEGYGALARELVASGEMIAGDELEPTATATTLRVRNDEVLLTDGPFAESREQLGGYFLIEAKNLDRAIEIARKIPSARFGAIEIRPIHVVRDTD